jgi:cysteine desulfurase
MMLTTKSRYAVMAILEVASNSGGSPMKLADISSNQTIPLNYLEQLFLKLKNANIVTSVKGPGGGYRLNCTPDSLKIIDIIDGVEENTKMTRCAVDKTCRKNGVKCMTHDLWKGLGNQIRDYFSAISVGDLLSQSKEGTHIYLDHNSTTTLLKEAKEAMLDALAQPANPSSIHSFGRNGKKFIETARKQIAALVGIENNFRDYQITFTASGTEANNLIISNFKEDKIFISPLEHASILSHTKFQDNIHFIKVDKDGLVDLDDLRALLEAHKMGMDNKALDGHGQQSSLAMTNGGEGQSRILISIIFAGNETGVIQNIKKVTEIAHSFGALVHSDCVQALGKIPVDLVDLDLDFATISAHKIGGPVGAGALIAKTKHHLLPHIIGGGQEKGLRSGTENIAAIAGFGAAAEVMGKRHPAGDDNRAYLRNYLETELLKSFPTIKIVSHKVSRLPNTSLIINKGKKAETQIIAFDLNNIAISSGAACSSGKVGSSRALIEMGFDEEERNSAIRISLGETTTKNEIDKFLETYNKING